MLNKITKVIGFGAIIGLSGLCTWGSDDYEIWDGNGPMPTENVLIEYDSTGGIKKVIIFKESSLNAPELAYEEDETKPSFGRIGLKLNLPEELIKDCKHKYVQLNDETLKQELDIVVSSEESFHAWCDQQKSIKSDFHQEGHFYRICAYILPTVSKKNYLIPGDFCKRVDLGTKVRGIHEKGVTYCMSGLYDHTPVGEYLDTLEDVIELAYDLENQ